MNDRTLDTRQLRAFVTLARLGSFTRAAEELHLTQSAVSHTIRSLEEDLGFQLFKRKGREVALNDQGRQLFRYAEKILRDMSNARAALEAMEVAERGQLRIACSNPVARFLLPGVLREFKECFPQYDIIVEVAHTSAAMGLLSHDRTDLVIGLEPSDKTVSSQPLFQDQLRFLMAPQHPWASRGAVRKQDVGQERYVLGSRSSITYGLIEQWFLRMGVRRIPVIEVGGEDVAKELVRTGIGVGISPAWTSREEEEKGTLVSKPMRPTIRRRWAVMWEKDRVLNLAENTFTGLVMEASENL